MPKERNGFSASNRLRNLNRSAANIPNAWGIANIALNDAMILLCGTNSGRMELSESTAGAGWHAIADANRIFRPGMGIPLAQKAKDKVPSLLLSIDRNLNFR